MICSKYYHTAVNIYFFFEFLKKVAQGVQDTLLHINLLNADQPTKKEIDLFIQAIEMNPAVVSLKGYTDVNRELLSGVKNKIFVIFFMFSIILFFFT